MWHGTNAIAKEMCDNDQAFLAEVQWQSFNMELFKLFPRSYPLVTTEVDLQTTTHHQQVLLA